jgi:hypothetical protein
MGSLRLQGSKIKAFFVLFLFLMKFFTPKFMKIRWSSFYSTFKVASSLINSKRGRQFFLEIMKAYGRKTRKFIIAPKMALH